MTHMRQVTKDEFEVLTRFHPGEVRYYIDVAKALNRNKGAKISVKRKPVVAKQYGRNAPKQHVQLTTKDTSDMRPESLRYIVYRASMRAFGSDPTKVMTRGELTTKLCRTLPNRNKKSHIVPTISGLIKSGYLRYTGTLANGA